MRLPSLASFIGITAFVALFGAPLLTQATVSTTTPTSGSLIRSESYPAVYYMGADGFRYVFPNDKTYFTWYSDFDDVVWISDAALADIQIGGNVTYKPGVKMIKIQSDPKTYAISQNGTLRWITSEEVASGLYGTDWNTKIDDVADGFFTNYTVGEPIMSTSGYDVSAEQSDTTSINDDKDLSAPEDIGITTDSYSPASVTISVGSVVRFTNNDTNRHTATADDGSWGSGTLEAGENFSRQFDEAGTYNYFCSYHPDLQGKIIVE